MDADLTNKIENFMLKLRNEQTTDQSEIATLTVELLRKIISQGKWTNTKDLIELLRKQGKRLTTAQPSESTISNMVRRVLKIVREEHAAGQGSGEETLLYSLQNLFLEGQSQDYSEVKPNLKGSLIDAINELLSELETTSNNIASQALHHVHSSEVIMTGGRCQLVEAFLRTAARKRNFKLIIAETAPSFESHGLASRMAQAGVETTVITDSAVFAMMARVNKVIIGTQAVLADGSLKAFVGAHTMALAARYYNVPVVVVAPLFKQSPDFMSAVDHPGFNKFVSPDAVLNMAEGKVISKAEVGRWLYEYVPSDLVTLFVAGSGGYAPSYVYSFLSELYHPEDREL